MTQAAELAQLGTVVTVDSTGSVGIGTSSPNAAFKLDVTGAVRATTGLTVNGGNALQLLESSNNNSWYTKNNANNLTFTYNSSEYMRIDSSGTLLVGTTSNIGNGKANITFNGGSGNGLVLNSNPSANPSTMIYFLYGGSGIGTITTNGSVVAYNTSSDYRLKENVTPMTTGLATISALRPVTYDWISDKSQGEGFIAHELQAVIPQAVCGGKDAVNEDGSVKPQGVDYSKVVVHLVAAIQELSAKNDALEARLAALEAK